MLNYNSFEATAMPCSYQAEPVMIFKVSLLIKKKTFKISFSLCRQSIDKSISEDFPIKMAWLHKTT